MVQTVFKIGDILDEKYYVTNELGKGAHGKVYGAKVIQNINKNLQSTNPINTSAAELQGTNSTEVAIKIEEMTHDGKHLKSEANVLQSLQKTKAIVPKFYSFMELSKENQSSDEYGNKNAKVEILIMEKLKKCVSSVMHHLYQKLMPTREAINIAKDMLQSLCAMHCNGYIHQDVKPSNFVETITEQKSKVDPQDPFYDVELRTRWCAIDFGLSRKIEVSKEPKETGLFFGNSMFASLASHQKVTLDKKDDLYNWFYCVIIMLRGQLPWHYDASVKKNRDMVELLKEYYTLKNPKQLLCGLVGSKYLLDILLYLNQLNFGDQPDYSYLVSKLKCITIEAEQEIINKQTSLEKYNMNEADNVMNIEKRESMIAHVNEIIDLLKMQNTDMKQLETVYKKVIEKDEYFFSPEDIYLNSTEYCNVQKLFSFVERKLHDSRAKYIFCSKGKTDTVKFCPNDVYINKLIHDERIRGMIYNDYIVSKYTINNEVQQLQESYECCSSSKTISRGARSRDRSRSPERRGSNIQNCRDVHDAYANYEISPPSAQCGRQNLRKRSRSFERQRRSLQDQREVRYNYSNYEVSTAQREWEQPTSCQRVGSPQRDEWNMPDRRDPHHISSEYFDSSYRNHDHAFGERGENMNKQYHFDSYGYSEDIHQYEYRRMHSERHFRAERRSHSVRHSPYNGQNGRSRGRGNYYGGRR